MSSLSPCPGSSLFPSLPFLEDYFPQKITCSQILVLVFVSRKPHLRQGQTRKTGWELLRWSWMSRKVQIKGNQGKKTISLSVLLFKPTASRMGSTWAGKMLAGWSNGMWDVYFVIFHTLFINEHTYTGCEFILLVVVNNHKTTVL